MSTPAAIHTKVLQALGDYLKRDPGSLSPGASLRDDLGLDSMATIELLYRVEEAFDFQIPDQDLQGLRSVQDVIGYVERRLSPAAPSATTTAPAKRQTTGRTAPPRPKAAAGSPGRSGSKARVAKTAMKSPKAGKRR